MWLSVAMVVERTSQEHQKRSLERTNRAVRNIPKAQETIYTYLLEIVNTWPAEDVLNEFRHLFIHHVNTISSHILPSLYEIVFANQQEEFRNTLKRSCYILINNWDLSRNHASIQQLIQSFNDPILDRHTVSPTLRRLRSWIKDFVNSQDFEQLKLFASRYDQRQHVHWSERYTSYLLVPQYIDLNNPEEQRHAARALSRQLKEKFKFDLAMYTAKSQAMNPDAIAPADSRIKNPTFLGDDVLRLIKGILARRGIFSYTNLANIFLEQTKQLSYAQFKQSLQKYLVFSVDAHPAADSLKTHLSERLSVLYPEHDNRTLDNAILLRTCNRIVDFLTTENRQEPSPIFVQLLTQGQPFTLVVVLLKLVLICRYSRTHLEARIADLIQYYKEYPDDECQWVINFFEIFDITMTIYAENIEFNLIDMAGAAPGGESQATAQVLDTYRIFSQLKRQDEPDIDPQELERLLAEELTVTSSPVTSSQEDTPPPAENSPA